MVPIISGYNTYSRTKFYLACPACKTTAEITVPAFLAAINKQTWFVCSDCQARFIVKVELLNDSNLTPLAVDGSVRTPESGDYKVEWIDAETVRLTPRH